MLDYRLRNNAVRCTMLALLIAASMPLTATPVTSPLASLRASDDPEPVKEFKERVKRYVNIHKKVDRAIDPVEKSSDAALLVKQKEQFAQAVRHARPNAVRGEIFISSVRPIFLSILKRETTGPSNAKARSMILGEGNPKGKESEAVPPLKVNASYPTAAPSSTVPPSVLLALPELPEQLEYRFIGRDLILRDTAADVIVDFIKNAIP